MSDKSYRRIAAVKKTCEILAILSEAREPITGQEVAIRVMLATAAGNPVVEVAVEHVRQQTDQPESDRRRPPLERLDPACRMEIDDIPRVLRIAHAGLHNYLAQDASLLDPAAVPELIDGALEIARSGRALHNAGYIRTGLVNATVAALVGVISVDRVCEARP